MLVKNWMSTPVVFVNADDYMQHAIKLLTDRGIRMLPVLKKGELVGVVTDRDLKRASASDASSQEIHALSYLLSTIKIKTIMSKPPVTVPPDYTVEETALVLLKHKISGVPVVDSTAEVVGVITQSDIFRVMISLTGVGKKGIQFAFEAEDRPGTVKEITDIIREAGGRIVNILTSYDMASAGYRRVYIRAYQIDRKKLQDLQKTLKETATILYMVDHREGSRTVYC